MTKATDRKKLMAVKLALGDKYASLARIAGSQIKQREFKRNSERYYKQAEKLSDK